MIDENLSLWNPPRILFPMPGLKPKQSLCRRTLNWLGKIWKKAMPINDEPDFPVTNLEALTVILQGPNGQPYQVDMIPDTGCTVTICTDCVIFNFKKHFTREVGSSNGSIIFLQVCSIPKDLIHLTGHSSSDVRQLNIPVFLANAQTHHSVGVIRFEDKTSTYLS